MSACNLTPDLDEARRFLAALDADPDATFGFATLSDRNRGQLDYLAARFIGDLNQMTAVTGVRRGEVLPTIPTLIDKQRRGAGVFVVVNEVVGGTTARCVTRIRAVIADADTDEQLASVNHFIDASGLTPSMVVSSGGVAASGVAKQQLYWRLGDCPVTRFTELQLLLLSRIGTDPSVKDLARVLRLPGFWHQKREPRMTRIVALTDYSNYDCRNFVQLVQAQPQICDPGPVHKSGGGNASRGARHSERHQGQANQAHQVSDAGGAARLHELLDHFGGLITPAVRTLLREAQAPGEGTTGNRHATLVSTVAWLVRTRWGDDDIQELVLPVINDEWNDGDWDEHLGRITTWVRERETGVPLPPRPDWLPAAAATRGAATRLSPEQVARVTAAFRSDTTEGPA